MNKLTAMMFSGLIGMAAPALAAPRGGPIEPGDPSEPTRPTRPTDPVIPRPFPLPPPIIIVDACPKTFEQGHSYSWDKPLVNSASLSWTAGVTGGLGAYQDCDKLAAEAKVDLHTTIFGISVKPFEIVATAATHKDKKNSVDVTMYAFGQEIGSPVHESTNTQIYNTFQGGYVMPIGFLNKKWSHSTSDFGTFTLATETVANIGASVNYEVNYDYVGMRAGSSAVLNSQITASAGSLSTSAQLEIVRLTQGGRAELKPTSGNNWQARVVNSIALTDVLGIDMSVNVGKKISLFNLKPTNWYNDYDQTHDFTNSL